MPNQQEQTPAADEQVATQLMERIVNGYRQQLRSPVLATPAQQGLDFEEISFPSEDGVPLEAWFIPATGSNKLIIANHPRWFNRYGFASHLEPFKSMFASFGNDFEVNFINDYKALHDAGYNVLTYDLRNFGHSGAANGGIASGGIFEARDVIGSLAYVRDRPELRDMTIGLFSRCLGCNATLFAMARRAEPFAQVRCLVGVQPLSPRRVIERMLEASSVPLDRIDGLDQQIKLATSFHLQDMSPIDAARAVRVPTLLYQVRDDRMTRPADVQAVFDSIPGDQKELFWIEDSTKRWDGYTYFGRQPAKVLAWFDRYMR